MLALLIAADAAEFGRGVVGEGAVGLNFALDSFGERAQGLCEIGGEFGETGQFADEARGRRLQEGLPRGDVVGEARDGLQFGSFKGGVWDAGFGGELCGIEEAAERDGNLLLQHKADFTVEGMLGANPLFIGRGMNGEEGVAADG